MSDEIQRSLGRIESTLQSLAESHAEMKADVRELNKRVGKVEISGAKYGATAGVMVAIGIDLIKSKMGM